MFWPRFRPKTVPRNFAGILRSLFCLTLLALAALTPAASAQTHIQFFSSKAGALPTECHREGAILAPLLAQFHSPSWTWFVACDEAAWKKVEDTLASPSRRTATAIVAAIDRGVRAARPFFDHLAAEAVSGSRLNVTNNCACLFSRYTYLRDQFREKTASVTDTSLYKLPDGVKLESFSDLKYSDMQEARWVGIAAIEAFFSWTEHVLIHIGILLGNIRTGQDVAKLADSEWSEKIKAAIDLSSEKETKAVYEALLEVRRQVRNYMAHGAFGKHGEAFQFHSATGAVPVNLTDPQGESKFSMWSVPSFDEARALEVAESFIKKLWEGERAPAKLYLQEVELPVILSYASDGTYASAMSSEEDMENFVESLTHEMDNAANVDW